MTNIKLRHMRNLLVAYVGNYLGGLNNEAKALALLWGMRIVFVRRIDKLFVEGDILLIIKVGKGDGSCSWKIKLII